MKDDTIVYLDIDGTIITSDESINHNMQCLLQFFNYKGIEFGYATGRSKLEYESLMLPHTNAPVILCNGNLIYESNYLLENRINQSIFKKVCKFIINNKIKHFFIETPNRIYCTNQIDKLLFIKDFKVNRDFIDVVNLNVILNQIEDIIIRVYVWESELLKFSNDIISIDLKKVHNWLFINYIEYGKGEAIDWLKKNYFKTNIFIFGIGNDSNDISLFNHSDISIAINTDNEQVISKAEIYIKEIDKDGLLSLEGVIKNGRDNKISNK